MNNTFTVKCDDKHLWTVKDIRIGSMRTLSYSRILDEGIENFLIPGKEKCSWYKIRRTSEQHREPVRCIKTDSEDHLFSLENGALTHNTGGGKSVLQRLAVFHCIAYSKDIKFLGIDLKRVELSPYSIFSDTVLGIGTTLEDALEILRFGNDTMMSRYDAMQKAGVNSFKDMPNHGPAILIMVDEAGQLLDMSGGKGPLAEDTYVPNLEGNATISDLSIGDHVLGEDGKWHEVIQAYEPEKQEQYALDFISDDEETESVQAGEHHRWVASMPSRVARLLPHGNPDRTDDYKDTNDVVEVTVTAKELFDLSDILSSDDMEAITFHRSITVETESLGLDA